MEIGTFVICVFEEVEGLESGREIVKSKLGNTQCVNKMQEQILFEPVASVS